MKLLLFLIAITPLLGFTQDSGLKLTIEQAERLSALPLKCIQQEYPNKLGQVLNNDSELKSPKILHPTFFGCFDWHSSVHGHWLMIKTLKLFPEIKTAKNIREKLNQQITAENIKTEIEFFKTKYNESFERTYGWNWILKLQLELDTWKDKEGQFWAKNLQPLSNLIIENYIKFLPKLKYPIRTGEHINTAFGLCFAYDYALNTNNSELKNIISSKAKEFYLNDKNAPINYEPSGYDFLSPSFEEIELMQRILTKDEFLTWLNNFLPQLKDKNFDLEVGKILDRTDGKLVHLDGLNFSRAWCMYRLANDFPEFKHLKVIAEKHLKHSLPSIVDGDYMGEHWLATFALCALLEVVN